MTLCSRLKGVYHCIRKGISLRAVITCDIPFDRIPRSTIIPHPIGIVISEGTTIGENCTIRQNVTIGRRSQNNPTLLPFHGNCIGNNVDIGAGSMILGENIHIGNNVRIGAGAIVLRSVPEGTTVIGVWK